MKRMLILFVLLALLAAALPLGAQEGDCIQDFDPEADYFPQKVEINYAAGLEIEYHNSYKIVRTLTPFPAAEEPFEYVLVQCGAPTPEDISGDAQVITIPIEKSIALTTTMLPHLQETGALDSLVGVDSFTYINNPGVLQMIDDGDLVELGFGSAVNVEVALASEADVVFTYGYDPATDAHPVLLDAGIPTALTGEWLEITPLGRAEWIKFAAVFFNREAEANAAFDEIASEYEALTTLTAEIPDDEKPLVLSAYFTTTNNAWNVPGELGYEYALLRDAGAHMVLEDAEEVQGTIGSVPYSFETVYEVGLDAEIWVPNAFGVNTIDDMLALDPRFADFTALQEGRVWNNTARVNANGGNDYWETGVTNPHLLLADMIAIFHPELLPDHELVFYKNLQ